MPTLSSTDVAGVYSFLADCEARIGTSATSFEGAAQTYADAVYDRFSSSVALVRVFATVAFGSLPERERLFAERLAASVPGAKLTEETPVLSLFGTRGVQEAWNDRRRSAGHVAIPLVSDQFVASVPMIARLLQDLGLQIARDDRGGPSIVERVLPGGLAGVFYVNDASTAVDDMQRKIIAEQKFVAAHEVKSVFGVGGSYPGGNVGALIIFSRESLARSIAHRFLPLTSQLKARTLSAVMRGRFFR